jgi:hypothetical protein
LSSLAFGRGWKQQLNLFCVRDFAGQGIAVLFSGFAGIVITDSGTAVIAAASRRAASKGVPRTSAINRAPKGNSITGIVSVPIGAGVRKPA